MARIAPLLPLQAPLRQLKNSAAPPSARHFSPRTPHNRATRIKDALTMEALAFLALPLVCYLLLQSSKADMRDYQRNFHTRIARDIAKTHPEAAERYIAEHPEYFTVQSATHAVYPYNAQKARAYATRLTERRDTALVPKPLHRLDIHV